MDNVKSYILSQMANRQITREQAKIMLMELTTQQNNLSQDIAVIGLAGRFAEAKNIDEFWEFLKVKKNAIREFPKCRKDDLYEILKNPYYTEFMLGGSIDERDFDNMFSNSGYLDEIDKFDANFFGISPLEADYMDPNQRITLEVAWEAIDNAGYGGDELKGTKTGVYFGRDHSNYSYYRMCSEKNSMQLTGSWEGMVASRISYLLDLKGPCMVTDTACSAGMVSVHLAIQSLLLGECDVALAGGINLSSIGEPKSSFLSGASMSSVESDDSTIRTFDARANGTLWGEGVGVVMLKPLKKAMEDGDCVRAVIKATAINNDGTSNSITAPNAITQEKVILDAWKKASIQPETISYVEAHGTGTVLGDPIEIKGLSNAFKKYTSKKQFCAIGSLKTTMGHMVAASGIASIAKVVKSLESKTLAPAANFEIPNPYINFTDSPFYINDTLMPWEPESGVRRAIINSFGFIRTNCHVVLEEGIPYKASVQKKEKYCLTISTKWGEGLDEYIDRYLAFLKNSEWSLADICYTSNIGRGHYEHRILLLASDKKQLEEQLIFLRKNGIASVETMGIYHGYHNVVSDKKTVLEPGDITARMKKSNSNLAMSSLVDYLSNHSDMALTNMARLYVQGADINWKEYYKEESCKRVQIPTYPLQKVRHWAKPMKTKVKGMSQLDLHSLVQKEISSDGNTIVFESILDNQKDWVLADHRIENQSVLPGTTYLEMIRFAIAKVTGKSAMEFKNVFFLQPLAVEDGKKKTVQIKLVKNETRYKFTVSSKEEKMWNMHVEGEVETDMQEEFNMQFNIKEFKENATDKIDPFVGESDTGVFQFGQHWDVVRAVWQKDNLTLARLTLPSGLDGELNEFKLHPSILDNAVNLISQNSGSTFLPYMYKILKLYRDMPNVIYSYIQLKKDNSQNGETITYDVNLMDEQGNVFAQILDYTVKKINLEALDLGGRKKYLSLNWRLCEQEESVNLTEAKWAVVICQTEKGAEVVDKLKEEKVSFIPYYLGDGKELCDTDGINALLDDIKENQVQGILWGLDYTVSLDAQPKERQSYGVDALFYMLKGIIHRRIKLEEGFKVIVRNAWIVDGTETVVEAFSAASASIAKVVKREYPSLKIDILDVDFKSSIEDVWNKCLSVKYDSVCAIRNSGQYLEYMQYQYIEKVESYEYNKNGIYVVSGGLGGIGFSIAKKLDKLDVGKIILLGRSSMSEAIQDKIANLKKAEYMQCDVTKENEVEQLRAYIAQCNMPCAGIFHTAGMAGAGYLMNKTKEYFDDVIAPKIKGSINLSKLIVNKEETIFVLFSSITALTGEEGQSDYCCANAFMDSFARSLTLQGMKALSINWPSWEEVGMAARLGIGAEESLFATMPVKEGLEWLDYFMVSLENRIIPADFNYKLLKEYLDNLPFMLSQEILVNLEERNQESTVSQQNDTITLKLTGSAEPTQTELAVGNMFSNVLGLEEIDIFASFQDLGGNSLMTTQLLKLMNEKYPDVVDIADLFSYSSVSELAGYIDEKIGNEKVEETKIEEEIVATEENAHQVLQEVLDELGNKDLLDIFK